MTDNVNHPHHYADNGPFECIELTEQFMFNPGNAIKYVWRHNDKGKPVEDLSKSLWYVNREIIRIEGFTIPNMPSRAINMAYRLKEIDFAHMQDFWQGLQNRSLYAMKHAIEQRFDMVAATMPQDTLAYAIQQALKEIEDEISIYKKAGDVGSLYDAGTVNGMRKAYEIVCKHIETLLADFKPRAMLSVNGVTPA